LRSDELEARAREAADIGSVAAWPDWSLAKILRIMSARHKTLMGDEEIRARAGYGSQKQVLACIVGQELYPVPSRAIGGALEKVEIQLPGQTRWERLGKVETTGAEEYDLGVTKPGRPLRFLILDGFVQLLPSPDTTYPLRFTFYVRPSNIVQSQSSTLGGDGVVRGLIANAGSINVVARTVTVNVVPFNQLAVPPAVIPGGNVTIDIVRPAGTYALAMYSVPAVLAGSVFTLGGTDSMARILPGDFVRVEDQTDWPMGLPEESHEMVAIRTAMEIARDIGVDEKVAMLGSLVSADLERFRTARDPQVKSAPKIVPLRPMSRR
jgi:hypothetical protein